MSKEPIDVKVIFCKAVEKESDEERQAYLDQVCGDNPDLRAKLEELLALHDQADGFLEVPAPEVTLDGMPLAEGPGTVIGPYKLLGRIGEGGMAVVYMAEQERPLRRRVALKIIKLGMDTKEVIARFDAERQALALMDHPCIAKVFDAGATEAGRPFFVMELVQGISITQYCDQNSLRTKARLELFIQVCQAVQHAHQKGIIHRDIKPANVMVTTHDGERLPKVIDFGIAKATNQRLTEQTVFTRYAHIIGTPAYMSPEQAELSDAGIDTRSDIYSLGVLLYELLTGTTPLGEAELRKAGYIEMQRLIREQEPEKPSTKLSTLGETLTDVAKYRACSPDLLRKAIRGDLDWIVMKTLEKERDGRYDTVSSLALDIQRHLQVQPILARAPGTLYLLQKFLRRQGRRVAMGLAVILLLATAITTSLLLNQARKRAAETEASQHQDTLTQASALLEDNDLRGALVSLEVIVNSDHVGARTKLLHDQILRDIQEKLRLCTEKIENDPKVPNNYLKRAQYHHCLDEREAVLADMESYVSVLYPVFEVGSAGHRLRNFLVAVWEDAPANLGPNVNSAYDDWAPCIANDGLSLLFDSNRKSDLPKHDIWIAKRTSLSGPWNPATPLGPPADGQYLDASPAMSADGLSLYFAWRRANWVWDLCASTRATTDDDWGVRVSLGPVLNTLAQESRPAISADGLSLFFSSNREGGFGDGDDIYVSTRASTDQPWGEPVNLGSTINSSRSDGYARIAPDGRLLFFSSFRPGGSGSADFWVAARATKTDNWGPPVNLGPTINSPYKDVSYCLSADSSSLYFCSTRPGGFGGHDLWQMSMASPPEATAEEVPSESIQAIETDNERKAE